MDNCISACENMSTPKNKDELLIASLQKEIAELCKTSTAKFLFYDGKVAELCTYIKDNLSNALQCLLLDMKQSGELNTIITEAVLNHYSILENDVNELKNKTIGFVTPQMFGACGDGVCDDTKAIQEAINSGLKVHIPKGTYLISDSILVESPHVLFEDNGYKGKTIIGDVGTTIKINTNAPVIIVNGSHNLLENLILTFEPSLFETYSSALLKIESLQSNTNKHTCNNVFNNIRCVSIENVYKHTGVKYSGIGIHLISDSNLATYQNRFNNCICSDLYIGLLIENKSSVGINSNYFHIDLWNCTWLYKGNASGSMFTGCYQAPLYIPKEKNVCLTVDGGHNIFDVFAFDCGTFTDDTTHAPFLDAIGGNNTFTMLVDPKSIKGNIIANSIKTTKVLGYGTQNNRMYVNRARGYYNQLDTLIYAPCDNSLRSSLIEKIDLITTNVSMAENINGGGVSTELYAERGTGNIPTNIKALAGNQTGKRPFNLVCSEGAIIKIRFKMPDTAYLDGLFLYFNNKRPYIKSAKIRGYKESYGSGDYVENVLDLKKNYGVFSNMLAFNLPVKDFDYYPYVEVKLEVDGARIMGFSYISAIIDDYSKGLLTAE